MASWLDWLGSVQASCLSVSPPFEALSTRHDAMIGVGGGSGQLRSYVRPVARRLPLAIMGVRLRVGHQSVWRAQGTQKRPALPELP